MKSLSPLNQQEGIEFGGCVELRHWDVSYDERQISARVFGKQGDCLNKKLSGAKKKKINNGL